MLGWTSTHSRDYALAIDNNLVDQDLNRMKQHIERRLAYLKSGSCPECGEILDSVHHHRRFDVVPRHESPHVGPDPR
jgi:hypothetical protein